MASPYNKQTFSSDSIRRVLQNIIQRIPIIRPGGYITVPTSSQNLQASIAGILAGIHKLFHPTLEQPMKIAPSGEVIVKRGSVEAMTPQFTDAAQIFLYPQSTIFTPTPAATPPPTSETTTTTSAKASTKAPGAVAPTPATQTQKSTVTQQGQAPVSGTTTPPPQTQPATAKTGVVPTPPPAAGYSAPAPASLPPTPVMPGEATQTTTPENLARFEAMIRALQELTGGARYVPVPTISAEPFGPAGALERALRRLREREVRI